MMRPKPLTWEQLQAKRQNNSFIRKGLPKLIDLASWIDDLTNELHASIAQLRSLETAMALHASRFGLLPGGLCDGMLTSSGAAYDAVSSPPAKSTENPMPEPPIAVADTVRRAWCDFTPRTASRNENERHERTI